jgi:hypothetical protein
MPTDPYVQARTDLANTVAAGIKAGNAAYHSGLYASAVLAYQQAGNSGAVVVGPEIDAAGYSNDTQPFTNAAWQLNGQLAQINRDPTSTTQADAMGASSIVAKMLDQYNKAIAAGYAAANPPASAGNVKLYVMLGLGAVAVGVVGTMLLRKGTGGARSGGSDMAPTRRDPYRAITKREPRAW